MTTSGYANFLTAIGHTVRHLDGVYWFNTQPHVYMSFPFDAHVSPSSIDVQAILQGDGWIIRHPCDLEVGRPSYRIVIDSPKYGMESLSGKARNQTRRGLEQCDVGPISFDELKRYGLKLNRDTMVRQGRTIASSFDRYWINYYSCASVADGAEAWAAFAEGGLAAYLIAFVMEDVSHILIVRSSYSLLKSYPNNALIYGYVQDTLGNGRVREVSIGLESIQEGMDSLDHFKLGMGFRLKPVGQRVHFAPSIDKVLRAGGLKAMRWLLGLGMGGERSSKLAGLLRWYSEQPMVR